MSDIFASQPQHLSRGRASSHRNFFRGSDARKKGDARAVQTKQVTDGRSNPLGRQGQTSRHRDSLAYQREWLTAEPTQRASLNTTISSVHSVNSVLSCPFYPGGHRQCLIFMRLGCPQGSHMRQDFLISLTPPRGGAAFPLCGLLTAETWIQRIGHKLPVNIAVPGMCFNACFTPRWDTSGRTRAVTVISTKPGGTRTVTLGTSPNLHLQPCDKCTNSDFQFFGERHHL